MLINLRSICARIAVCVLTFTGVATPSAAQTAVELARQGFVAKERKQYQLAIQLFDEALKRGKVSTEQRGLIVYGRGVSFEALRMLDFALADLDAAIALLPNFSNSYVYRALIWVDRRELDRARDDLQQAIRIEPDSALTPNNLGSVYERKGELDAAIQSYDTAIRLDPSYAQAFYNRAHAYTSKRNYRAAIADYDSAIGLQEKFADAYSNRGGLYLFMGETERAVKDFDEAIRLKENDPIYWTNRANAYLAMNRFADAIADFDKAQKIDPGSAAIYMGRGRARLYSDEVTAAIDDLKVAVRLRPTNANPAIWLHIARVHQGQPDLEELGQNSARVDQNQWPAPVLGVYLGNIDVKKLHEYAERGDVDDLSKRRCEADFYVGEYLNHSRAGIAAGRQILQRVVERCTPGDVMFIAARAELNATIKN